MDELKPCPFCGKPGELIRKYVACSSTQCYAYEIHILIDEWNTRPIEDAIRAENAKLREALSELINSLEISFTGMELRKRVPEIKNARTALGGK